MKFKIEGVTGEEFASRLFYVAWQRCGGPLGMGVFQDRGPGMTEEQVVANVKCDGDYPAGFSRSKPGAWYGDYVFGRMMKTGVAFDGNVIDVTPDKPRDDYQGWSRTGFGIPELVGETAMTFKVPVTYTRLDEVPAQV